MHWGSFSCSFSISCWRTLFQSYVLFQISVWLIWIIENPSLIQYSIFSISFTWTLSGVFQLDICVKCCAPSTSIRIFLEIDPKSNGMIFPVFEKRHQIKRSWVVHSPSSDFRKVFTFASVFFLQYGHQYPVRTLYNFDLNSEWHRSQSICPHKLPRTKRQVR